MNCRKCKTVRVPKGSAHPSICEACYAGLDKATKDGAIALAFYEAARTDSFEDNRMIWTLLQPFVPWEAEGSASRGDPVTRVQLPIIWEGAAHRAWRSLQDGEPARVYSKTPAVTAVLGAIDASAQASFVEGFVAGAEFEYVRAQEDS